MEWGNYSGRGGIIQLWSESRMLRCPCGGNTGYIVLLGDIIMDTVAGKVKVVDNAATLTVERDTMLVARQIWDAVP